MTLSAVAAALVLAAGPVDPAGLWRTATDQAVVRLERCGADLCGRAVGSSRLTAVPGQTDTRNHDPSLRSRPILGLLILRVHAAGEGKWSGGWIYNPSDGGTYHASVQMTGSGTLRLRGCIREPLCRSQTWTRVG